MSYWDIFFKSGRIEDYLNYCRSEKEGERLADLKGTCDKRERPW